MNRQIVFLAAIAMSVISALLIFSYIQDVRRRTLAQYETVEVVVAAQDIPARTIIRQGQVRTELVPRQFVQPGAFTKVEDVVNKVSLVPLKAGSQMIQDVVLDLSQLRGLSSILETGLRAITLRIDEVRGVGGHIVPGDYVDIYAILPPSFGSDPINGYISIPFQHLQVIAVGSRLALPTEQEVRSGRGMPQQLPGGGFGTVTLKVDPELAEDLIALNQVAYTVLALRPVGDLEEVDLKPVRIKDIIRKYKPKVRWTPPKKHTVELLTDEDRRVYEIKGKNVVLKSKKSLGSGGSLQIPGGGGSQPPVPAGLPSMIPTLPPLPNMNATGLGAGSGF